MPSQLQRRVVEIDKGSNLMILGRILAAAALGLIGSIIAWITGHVGFLGAFGLYVSIGWAVILASFAADLISRPGPILGDRRKTDVPVLIDRRSTDH